MIPKNRSAATPTALAQSYLNNVIRSYPEKSLLLQAYYGEKPVTFEGEGWVKIAHKSVASAASYPGSFTGDL
jgi:hypothetical protein